MNYCTPFSIIYNNKHEEGKRGNRKISHSHTCSQLCFGDMNVAEIFFSFLLHTFKSFSAGITFDIQSYTRMCDMKMPRDMKPNLHPTICSKPLISLYHSLLNRLALFRVSMNDITYNSDETIHIRSLEMSVSILALVVDK